MAAFIKFDGVDGEAKDQDHQNWSDLDAFSQGMEVRHRGKTPIGVRRSNVVPEDIFCSKELDKSSPKLAEAVLKLRVFPKVDIHVTASFSDAGPAVYYAYELKNVLVTSYNISGSGDGSELPIEELALSFAEIKVTYTERDNAGATLGNVEYSWKSEQRAKANKKVKKK